MKIRKTLAIFASTLLATFGSMHMAHALEVNQASVQELDSIKGLGQKRAQAIVDERTKNGPFKSAQDLADRIKGIGDKSVQTLLKSGLTVNGSSVAPAATPKASQQKSASATGANIIGPSNTQASVSSAANKPKSILIPASGAANTKASATKAQAISLPNANTASSNKATPSKPNVVAPMAPIAKP